LIRHGLLIQDNELVIWATLKRVHGFRNSSGNLAIFAAIRPALNGQNRQGRDTDG
jgi:hypothetical protein